MFAVTNHATQEKASSVVQHAYKTNQSLIVHFFPPEASLYKMMWCVRIGSRPTICYVEDNYRVGELAIQNI